MAEKQTMEQLAHQTVIQMRIAGHFLYYHMEGKAGQRRILAILRDKGSITQKELQDIIGIRSGSISEIMSKIEADGLVTRTRSKSDNRKVVLEITPKGTEKYFKMQAEYDDIIGKMFQCVSPDQLQALFELLKTLNGHWKTLDFPVKPPNNT